MAIETTYTSLRENLATILGTVFENQEVAIVRRRGAKDVALVPAAELASAMETAHLLRSPKNAKRLRSALQRAKAGKSNPVPVERLRRELGVDSESSLRRFLAGNFERTSGVGTSMGLSRHGRSNRLPTGPFPLQNAYWSTSRGRLASAAFRCFCKPRSTFSAFVNARSFVRR
jgi:antitoxin YefM